MYEVELLNGDSAEATTLEGIVAAARRLWDEATSFGTWNGHEGANFIFQGKVIHSTLLRKELNCG